MSPLVDATHFPLAADALDYADPRHIAALPEMRARAEAEVTRWRSPPIKEVLFAFGYAPIVAVFLVRFERPIARGELKGETEMWAVAGDLPAMCFETTDAPTPADALRLYCAIAWDWGQAALGRRHDISESYPIPIEPTRKLAKMLFKRVKKLRKGWIPVARRDLARLRRAARWSEAAGG